MILPYAFVDGTRALSQSDYLAFSLHGEKLVARHPRLAAAAKLVAGWASAVDAVVEEGAERNVVVGEELRPLFIADAARRAFVEIEQALSELDAKDVQLEDEDDVAGALDAARRFVTAMRGVLDALDAVRAPAWQAQWRGVTIDARPVGTTTEGLTLVTDGQRTFVELREDGEIVQRLEIDGAKREARLVKTKRFVAPSTNGPGFEELEPSDADREIALYDWIDDEVAALEKLANPVTSSPPLICSFCGKNQREVRKLIAGPSCYICDECVVLCGEIVREEIERAPE